MTLIDLTVPSLQQRSLDTLPVAIIGAGPVGLAAAANLVERGIDFVIYESGDEVASSIRQWGHTRLFSPWKHVVDPASRRLLEATGWQLPSPDALPTGAELVGRYLEPLASLESIASSAPHRSRDRRGDSPGHGPHPHGTPRGDAVPAPRPNR